MKGVKRPTNDKNNTPATSATKATKVKVGKEVTKDSQRIAEEIQAAENMLHYVTKLTASSHQRQMNKSEKLVFDKIEETVTTYKHNYELDPKGVAGYISSTQYQDKTNSILDIYQGLDTFLKFRHEKFFGNTKSCTIFYSEHIERFWNIIRLPNEISKPDAKDKAYLVLRVLKAVRSAADVQTTKQIPKEGDNIEITTDLWNNDSDSSVHGIQKPTQLPQECTVKKKGEKEGSISTASIQETEKSPEIKCDAETLMKNLNSIGERLRRTKDSSEIKHTTCHKTSVHGIQKSTNLPQELTAKKNGEKEDRIYTGNIQITGKSPDDTELECDAETLIKKSYDIDERSGRTKACSEIKHSNEMVGLLPKQNKSSGNSNQGFQSNLDKYFELVQGKSGVDMEKHTSLESVLNILKETRDLQIAEIEAKESNTEAFEKINASKDKADMIDDIIRESKEADENYKKEMECDSATDYIEVAGKVPLNFTEDQNEREKGNNEDIQDFHFKKDMMTPKLEIEYCARKDKYKITSHEKTKILPVNDLNPRLEGLISKQNFNLDDHRDVESEVFFPEKKRESSYSEKGHITTVAETEYHEKIRDATDLKDEEIEETVSTDKSEEKPKASVEELEKKDTIHFEFETDNINICAGNKFYYCSSKDKQGIPFNFKDENIQISFAGNQIFVSTENNEFVISFRKIDSVNLTSEATQTDTLL